MTLLPRSLFRTASLPVRGHLSVPVSRFVVYQQTRWHNGPLYKNTNKSPETESPIFQEGQQTQKVPEPIPDEKLGGSTGNPHRQFYKSFGFPILRMVLGALFTYQILYWSWLKLESLEKEEDNKTEIQGLKQKLVEVVRVNQEEENR